MHKQKVTNCKLGSQNYICPEMTKMGSIIDSRIDYNGVGTLKGRRHIQQKLTKYSQASLGCTPISLFQASR